MYSREVKCWDIKVCRDFWNQLKFYFISYQLNMMRIKYMYSSRFKFREDAEEIMILDSLSVSSGIP